MKMKSLLLVLAGLGLSMPALALAARADAAPAGLVPTPVVPDTVVAHTGHFNGQRVKYEAQVENYRVHAEGAGAVDLVATSYVVPKAPASRPVVFAFNGGPIAPSVYVQMLALGPKRLDIPQDLSADPATFKLVDNSESVLDVADLVFYDPAGTGYSRFVAGTDPKAYFSVAGDASEFVAFVHAWLDRHGRASAPVYIVGESYGTLRTAESAALLAQEKSPINLRGLFLMGQAVNLTETSQRPENIVTYAVSLPTLAALGWYHGRVDRAGRSFEKFLDEVRRFAAGPYLTALYQGSALPADQRHALAQRLQALTGVDAAIYERQGLRLSKNQFRVELLKDQNLVLGASDGRYTAHPDAEHPLPDASAAVLAPAEAAFAGYARQWLDLPQAQYVTDSPVNSLADWDWGSKAGPFGNWPYDVAVRTAMEKLPELRVRVGVGYYDTLTTLGASEYLLRQSGWPADRVDLRTYQGGHMSYTNPDALKAFSSDLRELITAPAPAPQP